MAAVCTGSAFPDSPNEAQTARAPGPVDGDFSRARLTRWGAGLRSPQGQLGWRPAGGPSALLAASGSTASRDGIRPVFPVSGFAPFFGFLEVFAGFWVVLAGFARVSGRGGWC